MMNAIEGFARAWAMFKLTGDEDYRSLHRDSDRIEKDGRKRKSALRTFIEKGYLRPDPADKENRVLVTDLAFISMTQRPLTMDVTDDRPGRVFSGLPIEEVIHVADHPHDYEFSAHWDYGSREERVTPGEFYGPGNKFWHANLYVAPKGWLAERAARKADAEFHRQYVGNLPWGWEVVLGLSEDDAKRVGGVSGSFPFGSRVAAFGDKPENWAADIDRIVKATQKEIAEQAERLVAITKVQVAVLKLGGWDKFREQFKTKLRAAIEEQRAEEKEG